MARALPAIEADVRKWLQTSTAQFHQRYTASDGFVWVLKFIDARFLGSFMNDRRLAISATPGFTWGDAVYVTPLSNPYSTMMYGRAGIMGRVPATTIRLAYDAAAPRGLDLYQEWIQHSVTLVRTVMTTIHANLANRVLRNSFRRTFKIDVVFFSPDQFNIAYVDRANDRWFAISDWSGISPQAPGQRPRMSSVVLDCEWTAIVGEQFEESAFKVHFNDLFARSLQRPRAAGARLPIVADLQRAYTAARSGKPRVILVEP